MKVSIFHEFYNFVETVHAASHTVFLECDVKDDQDVVAKSGIKIENMESNSDSETDDNNSNINGPIDNGSSHENDDDRNTELQISEKIVEITEKPKKISKPKKNVKRTTTHDENVKKKSIKKGANNTFQ